MRNKASVFANIGASSHSKGVREANDYYSTDESAIQLLDKHGLLDKDLPYWETAVGGGAVSKRVKKVRV